VSELRRAIAELARLDPELRRFGAHRHRYALAPPIAVDASWPDDFRAYLAELGGGGVGPYYGLVRVDRVTTSAGPDGHAWLPIAHLGCGYAAMLVLDGPARGEIWIDAHVIGITGPIRPSFTAYYLDWIDRLAHGRWLDSFVPPGRCALANALTGYLGFHEQRLGVAAGSLAGDTLAEVLAQLGPGSIEVAGEAPLFTDGDPVDPCVACVQLIEGLGLHLDVVKPGRVPLADRA
jgi:hypothetical protein